MKNVLLIKGLLATLILASCSNPSSEDILRKSYDKCQSIKNGYYEMTHYMKYTSSDDSISSIYNCHFEKLPDDTIYSSAFHYQYYRDGKYSRDVLYAGDHFVSYSKNDSAGKIKSTALWAKDIKSYSHNQTFYSPLTDKKSFPLPEDSAYIDNEHIFEFLGEKIINNIPCYHIKMSIIPTNDSTAMFETLRAENNYWISKQDYIPIQYSLALDLVMNNDTMFQYEKNILTKFELNNLKDEAELKLSSIPSYIVLIDYEPSKRPELLHKETIAPDWSLISLDDKTVKLADFKGQIVLIDFFYKSCYPCMLALPDLQDLHERYDEKGVQIIGINPYDTKEDDDIDNFLAKRGITYTVLLGGKDVAKEYNVSGYPTIYLIDKEGKILFTQVGYGAGTETKLEEIIVKNL